ncbi:MAG: hypothetical protein OSB19_05615 [Opitutaceae bacterium]|jgi:hypothetical protein|nr:hypothetical protein [Opitutaceae bacterium]|tara:strand:- start:837 stop:1283 length:447 start_codon:yes stop_codon:yes gene_type:complete
MNRLEFRLDTKSVLPLLEHVKPLMEQLAIDLATPNVSPDNDELMSDFWSKDLLTSQRKDIAAIAELFDDEFLDTGSATVDEEDADLVLRGCAAVRLKIRERSLEAFSDEALESGELDIEDFNRDQRIGYAAYALFASMQELIISQLEL